MGYLPRCGGKLRGQHQLRGAIRGLLPPSVEAPGRLALARPYRRRAVTQAIAVLALHQRVAVLAASCTDSMLPISAGNIES